MLAALADPVSQLIIDELLTDDRVPAAQLAVGVQRRMKISRPAISTHVTELITALVVQRHDDGTISLTDPDATIGIIQAARDSARTVREQRIKRDSADHYRTERRYNRTVRLNRSDLEGGAARPLPAHFTSIGPPADTTETKPQSPTVTAIPSGQTAQSASDTEAMTPAIRILREALVYGPASLALHLHGARVQDEKIQALLS